MRLCSAVLYRDGEVAPSMGMRFFEGAFSYARLFSQVCSRGPSISLRA